MALIHGMVAELKLSLRCNWAPRHEGLLGEWRQLHAFFALGTRWRRAVSFTPSYFIPRGKSTWYRLDRRLGGPQSRPKRGSEKRNCGIPALYHFAIPAPHRILVTDVSEV